MPSKRSKAAPPAVTEDPLFQLDSVGSTSIRNDVLHGQLAARQRKGAKPLRSDQILSERLRTGAPAVAGRQTKGKGKERLITPKERKRLESMVVRKNKRGDGTLATATDAQVSTARAKLPSAPTEDLWSSNGLVASTSDAAAFGTNGKPAVKEPTSLRRHEDLSQLEETPKAIPTPHRGLSYNPTLEDHQAVLRAALEKAEDAEEKERIARELKARMDASTKLKTRAGWELYEGEVGSGEEESDAEVAADGEGDEAAGAKKSAQKKKKTVQKRKRQLKAAAEAQLHATRLRRKAASRSFAQLPNLVSSLSDERSLSASKRLLASSRRLSALSKHGLLRRRPPPEAFQLTEELSEAGLRGLKPEGSLWKDWQSGAKRRGKIEVGDLDGKGGQKGRHLGRLAKNRGFREVEKHAWKNFS